MMKAFLEHLPSATERAIQRASEPNGEALHRSCERARVSGLDDEMDVIVLHGELDDARVESLAGLAQRAEHHAEAPLIA